LWVLVRLGWVGALVAAGAADRDRASDRFASAAAVVFAAAVVVQVAAAWPLFADARMRLAYDPRGFYPVEIGVEGAPKRWSSSSGGLCLGPRAARRQLRFQGVDPRIEKLARTGTLTRDRR